MKQDFVRTARGIAIVALIFALSGTGLPLAAQTAGEAPKSANKAAAIRSLERAVNLLAAADWDGASFEARLGETYDASMADFPYIEALSLAAKGSPRADILERVETALADGYFWRTYSRDEALIFNARLKAETCRYADALALLSKTSKISSADADYARAVSLYGLGKIAEARTSVSRALERWPFDARFPRLFLTREKNAQATGDASTIAQTIISRLYVWEDEDRELLLLAVPFERDAESRVRDIRTFRSMGKNDRLAEAGVRKAEGTDGTEGARAGTAPSYAEQLATVYALEYGILGEEAAEKELFAAEQSGIALDSLHALCRLAGKKAVRDSVETRLDGYEGVITDDANGDGIVDSWSRYRLGRPVKASFDLNQDGYPDYSVDCDLGEPATIAVANPAASVTYDKYPAVRSVIAGDREYTMKPLALSWAPVEWTREDFGFYGNAFYTIRPTGKEPPLTERLLAGASAYYREGGKTLVTLDGGVPVSSETRENGTVVSWTTYSRGYPALAKSDLNGDGYFETTSTYGPRGALASVDVDQNGNRRIEYREEYLGDGTIVNRWDSDENGSFDIVWTKTADGVERTEWTHPDTGLVVVITVENASPREVSYAGIKKSVVRDPVSDVWWIGRLPQNSRELAKKIDEAFNSGTVPVVSYSITVDARRLNAVRTGGHTFAELVDE